MERLGSAGVESDVQARRDFLAETIRVRAKNSNKCNMHSTFGVRFSEVVDIADAFEQPLTDYDRAKLMQYGNSRLVYPSRTAMHLYSDILGNEAGRMVGLALGAIITNERPNLPVKLAIGNQNGKKN